MYKYIINIIYIMFTPPKRAKGRPLRPPAGAARRRGPHPPPGGIRRRPREVFLGGIRRASLFVRSGIKRICQKHGVYCIIYDFDYEFIIIPDMFDIY